MKQAKLDGLSVVRLFRFLFSKTIHDHKPLPFQASNIRDPLAVQDNEASQSWEQSRHVRHRGVGESGTRRKIKHFQQSKLPQGGKGMVCDDVWQNEALKAGKRCDKLNVLNRKLPAVTQIERRERLEFRQCTEVVELVAHRKT